jgi:Fe-S-cluster containining protein
VKWKLAKGNGELRFECTQCGDCCRIRGEYSHVYLSRREERALAECLGMSTAAFRRRYTFIDKEGWRELAFTEDRCVFLDDETNRCLVYPARPTACRTFPFWRELVDDGRFTRKARKLCEGVGRGRAYAPEEAEARMIEMELSELEP